MLKTLLASSSLSLVLLFLPLNSIGPISGSGASSVSPAHAEFGVGLGGIVIETDDDDDDYDDGYDDGYDD